MVAAGSYASAEGAGGELWPWLALPGATRLLLSAGGEAGAWVEAAGGWWLLVALGEGPEAANAGRNAGLLLILEVAVAW